MTDPKVTSAVKFLQEADFAKPPSAPLSFPKPTFRTVQRVTSPVVLGSSSYPSSSPGSGVDHDCRGEGSSTQSSHEDGLLGNVLVIEDASGTTKPDLRGYWIQRKLENGTCGSVRVGYLLRPLPSSGDEEKERIAAKDGAEWEVVPGTGNLDFAMVTIKVYKKSFIEADSELDPELAVLQLLFNSDDQPLNNHILGLLDVLLEDESYYYAILPSTRSAELSTYVQDAGRLKEGVARHFFKQIVKGLSFFQCAGLCHYDLCLENIFLQGPDCYISGMNMCLRIPYSASSDEAGVVGAFEGTRRRLILPQGKFGRPNCMAPELLGNEECFDGFAVDIWAMGVILFRMLIGHPPFVWAADDDPMYNQIAVCGKLSVFVDKWAKTVGDENQLVSQTAVDLLQNILREDPKDRLTLTQISNHPWMLDEDVVVPNNLSSAIKYGND